MNNPQNNKPYNRPATGSSSSSSSYLTKIKTEKALKNHNSLSLVDEKIERQLLKEIQLTKQIIQAYQTKFKKRWKDKNFNKLNQLISMEQIIINRDSQITHLNKQIKQLKSAPHQIRQQSSKNYYYESDRLFKLANQVRSQRQQLQNLQICHSNKHAQLIKKKQIIRQFQKKYKQICEKTGRKALTFNQFKQQRFTKKKQGNLRLKKSMKKIYPSLKQIIDNQPYIMNNQHSPNFMGLKQVLYKKQIAQSALKVAKKKHINQMSQLNAKLQFLKDQNFLLQNKLKQKEQQLKAADLRFSQSKYGKLKKKRTSTQNQ